MLGLGNWSGGPEGSWSGEARVDLRRGGRWSGDSGVMVTLCARREESDRRRREREDGRQMRRCCCRCRLHCWWARMRRDGQRGKREDCGMLLSMMPHRVVTFAPIRTIKEDVCVECSISLSLPRGSETLDSCCSRRDDVERWSVGLRA